MTKIYKVYPRITLGLKTYGYPSVNNCLLFDTICVLVTDVYDEVMIIDSNSLTVEYYDQHYQRMIPKYDLVTKSLLYIQKTYGVNMKGRVMIRKLIPFNSGLGSCAAIAAFVIKQLTKNSKVTLNFYKLATVLNPNIPFFLTGFSVARVSSYGDRVKGLSKISLPKVKILLSNIDFDKRILKDNYAKGQKQLSNNMINDIEDNLINQKNLTIENQLENIVFDYYPLLKFKHMMLKTPYNQVFLSGTGSSLVVVNNYYLSEYSKS